jgi:hypothetical protein
MDSHRGRLKGVKWTYVHGTYVHMDVCPHASSATEEAEVEGSLESRSLMPV